MLLSKEFNFIKEHLNAIDVSNKKVSKSNVGWHFDHSLKVILGVTNFLIKSDPKEYQKSFHLIRTITFAVGAFPRGKVQAPKRVLPPETVLKQDLEAQLNLANENLKLIKDLDDNSYFEHPIFKHLNKKQTVKFLKLHTNHHIKIVKDILK